MRRLGCLLQLVFGVFVIGGLYLAPSLYLDLKGIAAPGTVVEKEEQIERGRQRSLSWWRRLAVVVEYQPPEQSLPSRTLIRVDEATYDRLQVGNRVQVRYQPEQWMRDFILLYPQARLAHQTLLTDVASLGSGPGLSALLGLLLVGLLALARKVRTPAVRAAFLTLAVLDLGAFLVFTIRPAVLFERAGPRETATATVRAVDRITTRPVRSRRGRGSRGLRQMWGPIDRVQLELEVDGTTVVAVDDIDAGSMAGLEVGSAVAVSYPEGYPREARMVDAKRTHIAINRLNVIAVSGTYIGFALLLVLIGFLWERRRRRRRRLSLPQSPGP